MKRVLFIGLALSFVAFLGCASGGGGGGDIGGEDTEGGFAVRDDRGFERELGPAEIAYQSATQFLGAGNYDEAIRQLELATRGALGRVMTIAHERLQMRVPPAEEIVVVR